MNNLVMSDIEKLEAQIFGGTVAIKNFLNLIDEYINLLHGCSDKKKRRKFDEAVKTLFPLRTFLYNDASFQKIKVSSKNSELDKQGIDAELIDNQSIKKIQITLAKDKDDGQQDFFRQKILKAGMKNGKRLGRCSLNGKVFYDQKKMEEDLFKRCPYLKNISPTRNQNFHNIFNKGMKQYYIDHYYEGIEMPGNKTFYQMKPIAQFEKEIINKVVGSIDESTQKKSINNSNCDILLIGFSDYFISDENVGILTQQLLSLNPQKIYKALFVVGISKLDLGKSFFRKLY